MHNRRKRRHQLRRTSHIEIRYYHKSRARFRDDSERWRKIWPGTPLDGGEDDEGLDLRGVAIGCEGMFGLVNEVLVKLTPKPECLETFLGIFETVESASRTVSEIIKAGIVPGALEMMDQLITKAIEETYHFGFPLDADKTPHTKSDGPNLRKKALNCGNVAKEPLEQSEGSVPTT
ncbi:MAG TPA: hypothetical protein DHV39_17680 [Verrucomicrobiales bacterium]|nr:hypothetical protein [Verrucomicrobiales bacterium]